MHAVVSLLTHLDGILANLRLLVCHAHQKKPHALGLAVLQVVQ
jgi:hypothetical protein